jgi:hypothetical protein
MLYRSVKHGSITESEEHEGFENKVLRRKFGCNRNNVTGGG